MISLNCPAKLNLGLKVVGRRPDGYHDLSGLMVSIPWYDHLTIDVGGQAAGGWPDIELSVSKDDVCALDHVFADRTNIVVRTAELCLKDGGMSDFRSSGATIRIHLHKSIPSGTGLGGASSDAAGVIRGLDMLAREIGKAGMSEDAMRRIAAAVGSDSVFFLNPVPSLISGRGESFIPTDVIMGFYVVVAVPVERLSTRAVFEAWERLGNPSETNREPLTVNGVGDISPCLSSAAIRVDRKSSLPEMFENDLSDAVFDLCPRSAELLGIMRDSDAFAVGVTGSGSAVFGLFADKVSSVGFERAISCRLRPGEIVRVFQTGKDF